MSVTPWGGLELSGITIAQTSPVGPRDFLEARTFRLRVRFLSLFSRRLVIKEVSLINPNVVWPQDVEGKWKLPGREEQRRRLLSVSKCQSPASNRLKSLKHAAPPVVATCAGNLPSPATGNSQQSISRCRIPRAFGAVSPEVRRLSIKNGNFSFLDHTGRLLASFYGRGLSHQSAELGASRGGESGEEFHLQDRFFLEQLRSPLRYEPDVLELSKISARAGNGEDQRLFCDATGSGGFSVHHEGKVSRCAGRSDYRRRGRSQRNGARQIGGKFPGFWQNCRSGGVRWERARFSCATGESSNIACSCCLVRFFRSKN